MIYIDNALNTGKALYINAAGTPENTCSNPGYYPDLGVRKVGILEGSANWFRFGRIDWDLFK